MTGNPADEPAMLAHGETAPLAVVGIGASAGGIDAMRRFFAGVPADSQLAYVVILHLSPDYESRLAEVLQVSSAIPVTQVRDRIRVEANHVYVISPNQTLEASEGALLVAPMSRPEERRAPVDMFFRTLAVAYRSAAIALVLSGTGPNGSSGIRRVKELGGMVMAQDPSEAEYGDMPRNSIATGLVDHVLPVAAMPLRVVDYAQRLTMSGVHGLLTPLDPDGDAAAQVTVEDIGYAQHWRDVLTLLRVRTGHDFSNYKSVTLRRRVQRRMNVRGLSMLTDYADLMRADPGEPTQLMKELLISVTNFFRDAQAFAAIEQHIIPMLFDRKGVGDQVRVWSAGCATGEEAYSVAMLLAERAAREVAPPSIQVFATDLDDQAIAVAREGLYTEADVADVSPERVQRFFRRETGGYRVRRELREMVLFAHHNAIKDPPFSHLDLIVCRNLLIYLNRLVQQRLIETFHFALRPGGFLFLGSSEVAEAPGAPFMVVDKNAHIFESRSVLNRPPLPLTTERTVPQPPAFREPERRAPSERISPGELHLRLLEQYAPPSLIINEDYSVLHVSQHAADYLLMAAGEPSRDVFKVIHPDLRVDLRSALLAASRNRGIVQVEGVQASMTGDARQLRLTVKPVLRDESTPRGYYLVLFEESVAPATSEAGPAAAVQLASPPGMEAAQLAEELARIKTQLRATVEQYETHAEEARAANEELQAMNEELRSSAEELETSKEELQSVNEELTTVNQELKIKIEELGLTNNDFQNLINAADIGAIFLDRSLRVKLSTPRAQKVFNLLPSDVGRPLSDITSRILDESIHDDVLLVLERLQTIERQVQTSDGRVYIMRMLPYRTSDDRIDGVALTFHDITERHVAEQRLHAGEERQRLLVDSVLDYAIFTLTADGQIDSWNSGAERMFGYSAGEIIGRDGAILFTEDDRHAGVFQEGLATARTDGRAVDERWHVRRDGTRFYCSGVTTQLGAGGGFAKIARDLTQRQRAELALQDAHSELEARVRLRTSELENEVQRGVVAREHITTLLHRVVTAQEDERARIARDLHDQLGQRLTALRLALQQHGERCAHEDDITRALQLAQTIDGEVDFLAWELRPAALDDLGLAAALPRYVREWSAHYGVEAEFQGSGVVAGSLSPAAEIACYRIAQEALNNVAKHAQASRVDVLLERRDDAVMLIVEDNGVGFDTGGRDLVERGIGLAGMRERAALVGAMLQIESTPGSGTTVILRYEPTERQP